MYPHANTIVCIEDSKLLKRFQYDILHDAKGLQATLDELNSINYFHTYLNAEIGDYSEMLDSLMENTFELIKDISPDESVWRMFALYYDIHNMKLVAKEKFFKRRFDALTLDYGTYTLPTIRSAAVREADNILENEDLTRGFFEALRVKDTYDIDFILDKTYFITLKNMAGKSGSPGIAGFVTEKIDLFNISLVFQTLAEEIPEGYFNKAFSDQGSCALAEWQKYLDVNKPGEIEKFTLWKKYRHIWADAKNREQLLSGVDVWIDNYLIEKTKICKLMAFGIEPICAYFFNKLMEIKNIRILLEGKANHYSVAEIKKRMRIPYEI